MFRLRRTSALLGALLLAGMAGAQDKPASSSPGDKWFVDVAVTVSPKAAPVPPLKYRLFPTWTERTEGNAVPIYLRFAHERNDATKRALLEKLDQWAALAPDKIPLAEAREFLKGWKYNLDQAEAAARKKTADWGYVFTTNPIDVLLPDVQEMRMHVRLLVLKARVEMAENNYDDAVRTLATAFSFARQIGEGPFLINGLVGVAGAQITADAVLDLAGRPDAPNLYWALTVLPRPLIDIRQELELEQAMLGMQFPDLRDMERPRSAEEWNQGLTRVRQEEKRLLRVDEGGKQPKYQVPDPNEPAERAAALPEAKKYLQEKGGIPEARLQAMPAAQVILLAIVRRHAELRDELFAASYLPYAQAFTAGEAAERQLKDLPDTELTLAARMLLPAVPKVIRAQARLDRKIALQRVIEALRAYAAAHDGQLPDRLEDVHELPVPRDPGTGQAVEYRREGDTATLTSRLANDPTATSGLRYRVTLRKEGR